jgi:hypothetical protein
MNVRKSLYTLVLNEYEPAIRDLTFPLMKHHAEKIGACFHVINERKYPDWPITIEKLQVFDLARERNDEWSIFFDADALIHPDHFDITEHLKKSEVSHNSRDMAGIRWTYDEYFRRDGRNIGSCNWHAVASEWCRDLWHFPDDLTPEEAISRIHVTNAERISGLIDPEHLVDDYILSRNIARFSLKFRSLVDISAELGWKFPDGRGASTHLFHLYAISREAKIQKLLEVLSGPKDRGAWEVMDAHDVKSFCDRWNFYFMPTPEIPGWMTETELQWLYRKAKERERIAEIGVWFGRSTHALLSGCPGAVLAVDHFKGSPSELGNAHQFAKTGSVLQEFRKYCGHFPNLDVMPMDSTEAAKNVADGGMDMIFIDGEHIYEAVYADICDWYPKLKSGGLFCGHDRSEAGVKRALEQFGITTTKAAGSIWEHIKP